MFCVITLLDVDDFWRLAGVLLVTAVQSVPCVSPSAEHV